VVAGFNVIVFIAIAVLAHREKLQKKRNHQLQVDSAGSESDAPVPEGVAKNVALEVLAVEIRNP
jgi:ACS family pantothenate transporter-like MFS transporter